jgi:hypothetical protein
VLFLTWLGLLSFQVYYHYDFHLSSSSSSSTGDNKNNGLESLQSRMGEKHLQDSSSLLQASSPHRLKSANPSSTALFNSQIQHSKSTPTANNNHHASLPFTHTIHWGKYGLGHRLARLSASYHLWHTILKTRYYQVQWGTCHGQEIFSFLWGTNVWELSDKNESRYPPLTSVSAHSTLANNATILIRNDVRGYYAGQSYKNARISISPEMRRLWHDKLASDARLFRELFERFRRHHPEFNRFQQTHRWQDHFVVGVHIRAGNGEQDHFVASRRHTDHALTLDDVPALLQLLHYHYYNTNGIWYSPNTHKKPLLFFVATDTAAWLTPMQDVGSSLFNNNTTAAPLIYYPQARLDHGVSYHEWTQGDACLQGWKSSAMDMALLASADVVIATTRSTFTQIMPLSLVLSHNQHASSGGKHKWYCEMAASSQMSLSLQSVRTLNMTCFSTLQDWLWRPLHGSGTTSIAVTPTPNASTATRVESLPPSSDTVILSYATPTSVIASTPSVTHKLLVHLPDPQGPDPLQAEVLQFLRARQSSLLENREQNRTEDPLFLYGGWLSRKYRSPQQNYTTEWA